MRKTTFFSKVLSLFVVILSLLSVSCRKVEPTMLTVSESNVLITAEGGRQTVVVTSNTTWTISGTNEWYKVSPSTGNGNSSIEINVTENTSESRECTLIVQTTDGVQTSYIKVTQSELSVNLSANPTNIIFGSEKSDRKTMQVSCNTDWNISGLPDWLDADQLAGKGDRSVSFTTKSENSTAATRTAELTISAGNKTITVNLTQSAGLSECYIKPENIVTLYNGVAFLSSKYGNVKNYRAGYIKANDYNKFSKKELLELTRTFDAITEFEKVESIHNLSKNTNYYLLTLAYDKNDQEGELITTEFSTKSNSDSDALVDIGSEFLYDSNNNIIWETYPDGATDKYYTLFLSGLSLDEMVDLLYLKDEDLYYDVVKLAWYLNNEIERGSQNYKTKKGNAEIVETSGYVLQDNKVIKRGSAFQLGYSVFFTWGVNVSNNKFSGLARATHLYVEYNSVSKKNEIKKSNFFNNKKIISQID